MSMIISKRMILRIVFVTLLTFLTGCSDNIENIEQRDYATIMIISPSESDGGYNYTVGVAKEHHVGEKGEPEDLFEVNADNLDELVGKYGEREGKELSLSHLKAILTADDFNNADMGHAFGELLYELDEKEEIAKTCPMLIVENKESIVEYMNNAKVPIGSYINDLIRNAKRSDKRVPKLLNYLKYYREGTDVSACYIQRENDYLIMMYK